MLVTRPIQVKLVSKNLNGINLNKNSQLLIKREECPSLLISNLQVFLNEEKIGIIEDYWSYMHMSYAIELGSIRNLHLREQSGRYITIDVTLESMPNYAINPNIGNFAGIYGITDKKSNFVYVGQSSNIKRRIKSHFENLSIGFHHNTDLQEIFINNSGHNMEVVILEAFDGIYQGTIEDRKWLEEKERNWIKHYSKLEICLNKTSGEFVETKKTLEEQSKLDLLKKKNQEQKDKEFDARVRKEKKVIKAKLQNLQISAEAERKKLEPLLAEITSLKKLKESMSSWFELFESSKTKAEKKLIDETIKNLESRLNMDGTVLREILANITTATEALKLLKTSKQINHYEKIRTNKIKRNLFKFY